MTAVSNFAPGGYSFLPSVFQYSAGVTASPGYEIQRVRFRRPLPLAEGFDLAEQFIDAAGRPMTAFALASCGRRLPSPTKVFEPSTKAMLGGCGRGDCSTAT